MMAVETTPGQTVVNVVASGPTETDSEQLEKSKSTDNPKPVIFNTPSPTHTVPVGWITHLQRYCIPYVDILVMTR